jgi:hypothetical protein
MSGGQVYDQKTGQEQAAKIGALEKQLAASKLKMQQLKSTKDMSLSQAKQLQTTLDMLMEDDIMGSNR